LDNLSDIENKNNTEQRYHDQTLKLIVKILRDEIDDSEGNLKPRPRADLDGSVKRVGDRIIDELPRYFDTSE